ncbi:MAG: trypsin-like peptidase domain-containing protein [Spirochaetes bacterium]|nr:trypsin-like peptidase domain-containing protein [Spirochaetota bacterium]
MKILPLIFSITLITIEVPADTVNFNSYFINAAAAAKPSVVKIIAFKKEKLDGVVKLNQIAYGTGTIIAKSGYIVTNYHVVKNGDQFKAIYNDGAYDEFQLFKNGKYYVADYKTDIAVLKISDNGEENFVPIKLADSNILNEGEWVLAIGNPYGLKQSITAGIVSSKGRDNIGFTDIEDFIQTDVPINPGNSGGPLINLKGEMVGMNTAIRSVSGGYQGISFAIPSNIVKQVCFDLTAYGRVKRGWIGFIARDKNIHQSDDIKSVEILSVIHNSPAEAAGIKQNDIVKKIDDEKIDSLGRLIKVVGSKSVGSKIIIQVSRNGKIIDFKLILREKDEYVKIQGELEQLFQSYGLEIDEDASNRHIVVTSISPRGPYKEIMEGDVIVAINNNRISSLENFIEKYRLAERIINNITVLRDKKTYDIYFEDSRKKE